MNAGPVKIKFLRHGYVLHTLIGCGEHCHPARPQDKANHPNNILTRIQIRVWRNSLSNK